MDRLKALQVFVAVAEAHGFAPAARRLGLSPPAVTRIVGALEAHVGTALLRRTTRVVRPTPAGERFLDDARRILALLAEAEDAAAGAGATLRGEITVTASSMLGRMHVMPVVSSFLDAHPAVTVRALLVDRVVDLVGEGVDVAVRIGHLRDSSLVAVRVGQVRRVWCAAPAYLARAGAPHTAAALDGHELVVVDAGQGRMGDAPPPAMRVRLTVSSVDAAIEAAVAGRGLVRATSYQVTEHLREGSLVAVLEAEAPPPVPVHVLFSGGAAETSRVRAFVDHAVEALRSSLPAP